MKIPKIYFYKKSIGFWFYKGKFRTLLYLWYIAIII